MSRLLRRRLVALAGVPYVLSAFAFIAILCASGTLPAAAQVVYNDRALDFGIDVTWANFPPRLDYGAGVAMDDYDQDGDLDIFVATKTGVPLGVYRNDNEIFTDISDQLAICPDRGIKQVLLADLDNDGWRDIVLSGWEPDAENISFVSSTLRMYQGQPDGSFIRQRSAVIDSTMLGMAAGISAGDLDRDGDLDLYVAVWKPGQRDSTSRNRLLWNNGDWNFVDRAAALGVEGLQKSFQAVITDLSEDGWPDIIISEDKNGGATYYENNGDGTFTDRSVSSGLDGYILFAGEYADGMGIAVGDYNGDLRQDVYITNTFDGNILYFNNGNGTWTDVAAASGTASYHVGWGCVFFDCDNDIKQDLYVVAFGMGGAGSNVDRLFHNRGNNAYEDIGPEAGVTFSEDGFGMCAGDVNGDGGVDILLSHRNAPVRLLMNEGTFGNWVKLDLVGTRSNRDAIGAKVTVWAEGRAQFFEQHAGESYLSTHSHMLDIGLAAATVVDSVAVWWPSGQSEVFTDLAINQLHVLTEKAAEVTAPQATAHWEGSAVTVTWQIGDPLQWSHFELWRESPGQPQMVASQQVEPNRYDYSLRDPQASESATYSLRGTLSGSAEVMTVNLQAPPPAALPAMVIEAPRPNPFNPRVTLRYYLPDASRPTLRILDARGREVARLASPDGSGWQTAAWEGVDAQGRSAPSGIYFFEVRSATETCTTRMTLVR
jgi:hypothetical protein